MIDFSRISLKHFLPIIGQSVFHSEVVEITEYWGAKHFYMYEKKFVGNESNMLRGCVIIIFS